MYPRYRGLNKYVLVAVIAVANVLQGVCEAPFYQIFSAASEHEMVQTIADGCSYVALKNEISLF